MKRSDSKPRRIDLGAASTATQGPIGPYAEFVGRDLTPAITR